MSWLVDRCLRHPLRVAALSLLLLALAVFGLTQLGTSAAIRTLTGSGSAAYRADREVAKRFGDESILILVPASARDIALTDDLGRVLGLEGCLAGTAPDASTLPGGSGGACAGLQRLKPAKVVYGPGTFLNAGIGQISDQIEQGSVQGAVEAAQAQARAEAAARKRGADGAAVARAGQQAVARVAASAERKTEVLKSRGIDPANPPTLSDTAFVERLAFDAAAARPGTPKPRFAAVFPSPDAGLITLRLREDLSEADRRQAVELVQRAAGMSEFRLQRGGAYVVSGSPVLVVAVADELASALLALLAVGVLVMALVLALTFPERRRLLPLALALGTVAVVFGGIGLLGMSINLGTIATLPVLLGLAVDYGVQLHARVEEARRAGLSGADAVRAAVERGGRPVLLAAGATLAGFVALFFSPTPVVRGFALVLFVGVALAVFASFTLGLVLHARRAPALGAPADPAAPPVAALTPPGRGLGTGPIVRLLVGGAHRRPVLVLTVGLVLALGGVVLGAQEPVETDLQRLVPRDMPALREIEKLEQATGQSGEIQVLFQGKDLATPAILRSIDAYRARALKDAGYDAARGCRDARLCPLSTSFSELLAAPLTNLRDATAVRGALDGLPRYFARSAITDDRQDVLLSFGIPLAPVDEQRQVIERMRDALDPPPGVRATVTGLPVLVSDASETISSPSHRLLTLLGSLLLVGGLLVAVTRSWRRGLAPVLPVALAAGWSGMLVWLLGLPLNPLSVVLGALVVAIGTEFGVLLVERYQQERAAGHPDAVAIARTAASTGRAVGASAATTVAGFAVLAVSDIPLLRQFGLITVLDLGVAVLAVITVLPAVAALSARRAARRRPPVGPPTTTTTTSAPAVATTTGGTT